MTTVYRDPVGMAIIAAATDVHRALGPGLYERVYHLCLLHELRARGVPVESEVALPVFYKELRLDCGFRVDFIVSSDVIVEVKCVERLLPPDQFQRGYSQRRTSKLPGKREGSSPAPISARESTTPAGT